VQNYLVKLECKGSESFHAAKAATSVNLKIEEKLTHTLSVDADLITNFSLGLVVGSSGSGKTSLVKKIYGDECLGVSIDEDKAIIDQFPGEWTYDQRVESLTAMGLTAIPCWVRAAKTLSTGQRARADACIKLSFAKDGDTVIIDEWTSTVNREVAKIMSHSIRKFMDKNKDKIKVKIILVSCHYDIVEWLQPDWIIDCNKQSYENRRSLRQERAERLNFYIAEADNKTWKYFSKYHYLSSSLAGGKTYSFGLFTEHGEQIGFVNFANYSFVDRKMMHSNRVVIHPDYIGLGLGIKLSTEASRVMKRRGFTVMAKFASVAMYKQRLNHPDWFCINIVQMKSKKQNALISKMDKGRNKGKLNYVRYFFYKFIGD
jgi:ABC-type dipeptide/oligopeptide/nickel transport system ATPase subunit